MHSTLRTVSLLLLVAVASAAAACNDNTLTSTTPTSTVTSTETFTGTLTKIDPDSAQTIGVSLGTWNGTSCQVIIANDAAIVGAALVGTVSGVGNLCLRVYDVGKLATSEDYSVDVVHP